MNISFDDPEVAAAFAQAYARAEVTTAAEVSGTLKTTVRREPESPEEAAEMITQALRDAGFEGQATVMPPPGVMPFPGMPFGGAPFAPLDPTDPDLRREYRETAEACDEEDCPVHGPGGLGEQWGFTEPTTTPRAVSDEDPTEIDPKLGDHEKTRRAFFGFAEDFTADGQSAKDLVDHIVKEQMGYESHKDVPISAVPDIIGRMAILRAQRELGGKLNDTAFEAPRKRFN